MSPIVLGSQKVRVVGFPPSDSYNILCARTPLILEEFVFNFLALAKQFMRL
jgi:hypothetical protein